MSVVVHPGDSLRRSQRLGLVLLLGLLTMLGPFTVDLYLPAFPALQRDLGVSASAVQLTLTATTIGFGLGQLVVGPWSDRIGRRLPIVLATALHVGASIGAALAPDVVSLGILRALMGVGAAAGGVVAMAMVRDLFGGIPLVRMLARLSLVSGLAPVVAPLVGSWLLIVVEWRGIFWVLAGFGAALTIATAVFLRETLPPARRSIGGHSTVRQRYGVLAHDRVFVGVTIVAAMNFSGLFAYLSSSSFVFQDLYGLSPQGYGLLFAVNSVGIAAGVQLASRLARSWGPQWTIAVAQLVQLLAAAGIVAAYQLQLGFLGTAVPLWCFILGVGLVFPSVQVLALAHHGEEAGTAASVLGAANFSIAGLISPLVGALGVSSPAPMAAVMMAAALAGALALWAVVRPRTVPALAA